MEKQTENKWWVFNLDLAVFNGECRYDCGKIIYFFGTYHQAWKKAIDELCFTLWNAPAEVFGHNTDKEYTPDMRQALKDTLKKGCNAGRDRNRKDKYAPRLGDNNDYVRLEDYHDLCLRFACLELAGVENKEYAAKLTKAVWAFLKSAC